MCPFSPPRTRSTPCGNMCTTHQHRLFGTPSHDRLSVGTDPTHYRPRMGHSKDLLAPSKRWKQVPRRSRPHHPVNRQMRSTSSSLPALHTPASLLDEVQAQPGLNAYLCKTSGPSQRSLPPVRRRNQRTSATRRPPPSTCHIVRPLPTRSTWHLFPCKHRTNTWRYQTTPCLAKRQIPPSTCPWFSKANRWHGIFRNHAAIQQRHDASFCCLLLCLLSVRVPPRPTACYSHSWTTSFRPPQRDLRANSWQTSNHTTCPQPAARPPPCSPNPSGKLAQPHHMRGAYAHP